MFTPSLPTTFLDNNIELVLTVEEAAKKLRIGRTSMYALLKSGAVESVQINGLRRIPLVSLHKYIRNLLAIEQAA